MIKLKRALSLMIIVSSPFPLVGEGVGCGVGNLVGIEVGCVTGDGSVGLLVGGFVVGSGDGAGDGGVTAVGMVTVDGEGGKVGAEGVGSSAFSFSKNTNSVVKAPAINASTTAPKMMKEIIDLLDFRRSDSSITESANEISSD